MDILDVNSEEDFVLYKLLHGYNFAQMDGHYVGYYWLWKAGLVDFNSIFTESEDGVGIWAVLHVDVDNELGEDKWQGHGTHVIFPWDYPPLSEIIAVIKPEYCCELA